DPLGQPAPQSCQSCGRGPPPCCGESPGALARLPAPWSPRKAQNRGIGALRASCPQSPPPGCGPPGRAHSASPYSASALSQTEPHVQRGWHANERSVSSSPGRERGQPRGLARAPASHPGGAGV
uniref:Uncharacterized protein n=1 Tax=Gopherus evgoodei TaxID=1825980 RepID=A0A8C4YGK6_9SAUR